MWSVCTSHHDTNSTVSGCVLLHSWPLLCAGMQCRFCSTVQTATLQSSTYCPHSKTNTGSNKHNKEKKEKKKCLNCRCHLAHCTRFANKENESLNPYGNLFMKSTLQFHTTHCSLRCKVQVIVGFQKLTTHNWMRPQAPAETRFTLLIDMTYCLYSIHMQFLSRVSVYCIGYDGQGSPDSINTQAINFFNSIALRSALIIAR
jgi:hypothetical protein